MSENTVRSRHSKAAKTIITVKKKLNWISSFGKISVEEIIWRSAQQSYCRLLPQRLGIKSRGYTRKMQRVLVDFGCEHSFEQASRRVQEHYGIEVSSTRIRTTCLKHGQRAMEQEQAQREKSFRELPAHGAQTLVAQADGSMVCTVEENLPRSAKRPRQYKEIRVVAVADPQKATPRYQAGFTSVEQTGRKWGHCAREAGWGLNTSIHAVSDGACWIQLQSRETFGDQASFLVDFYHLSEYLAEAAPKCRSKHPKLWLRTQQNRLKKNQSHKILTQLQEHLEPEHLPDSEAPVRVAHRYLHNRSDQLDYASALEKGLPIGSGIIESAHKHLIQSRLKKPGSAWLESSAEAITQLRVLRANDQWNNFWNPALSKN